MKKSKKKEESEIANFYYRNKILIWLLIIVIIFILIMNFTNIGNNSKPVQEKVTINIVQGDNASVGLGNTIKLDVDINVLNASISWASSNPSVAKVENGNVTGLKYGSSQITATYIDSNNNKHSDTCTVTVVEGNPNVPLERVSFRAGDLYMPLNNEYQLDLILVPSNALINDKVFTSTDSSVATVNEKGVVKSYREGHTRIIATINGNFMTSIDVYVGSKYNKGEIVISPTSLAFNSATRKVKLGSSEVLDYSTTPSNADRNKITWSSSNSNIVSVNQNGKINAKNEGTAIISITSANGKKDSIIVEVYKEIIEVKDIIITSTTLNMEAGKTEVIAPVVSPSNATNVDFSYSSMDPNIASVTANNSNTGATISALSAGSTTIIIKSGNVEKRITINVTGESNNSHIDDDDPNLPTTIRVRSNKNNLAKSYDEVLKIPVSGVTTISVTMSMGVGKIKYCINKYNESACTPNIEMYADDTISIPSGGIYVLRVIKYDYRDNEISSSSTNYINGVLHYYINTKSDNEAIKYKVLGAYDTSTKAMVYPNKIGDKVTISLDDTTRYLKFCSSTSTSCTPNITVRNNYPITITKAGLWRIFIDEYDKYNKKIGETEVYYVYVKESSSTPIPDDNNFKASNLKIVNDTVNGKYLSVYLEANENFYNTRFCYVIVNKKASGTCNLDVTSSSVTYYNNGKIVRPKEELKTYYATMSSTNKYSFKFYLDALDKLYNEGNTNKDVIFEFSVKTSKGFSKPIKIRINMTKKTGNESTWNVNFIK